MSKKNCRLTTIFFDKIFLHYSTLKDRNLQQTTVFFVSRIYQDFSTQVNKILQHSTKNFCRMMLYFVKIYRKILANYNSPVFLDKFCTRKLKNLQILTAFDKRMPSEFVEFYEALLRQNSIDPRSCQFLSNRSLVNLRGRLSNCGEALLLQNSTKKLKKKYPHRGGYFLFLF